MSDTAPQVLRIQYGCQVANGRAFGPVMVYHGDQLLHSGRGDLYSESFRAKFAKNAAKAIGPTTSVEEIEGLLLTRLSELRTRADAAGHGHDDDDDKKNDDAGDFPLSDIGNAERMIARHGRDVRYCPPYNKWLVWDGRRWAIDHTGEIDRRAKDTVRAMKAAANRMGNKERAEALWTHAHRSEGNKKIMDMIKRAEKESGVAIMPDDLDSDPWLLNAENCTIDLRTGEKRPHRREDFITKMIPVEYDPDAICPTWLAFHETIFAGREDTIGYLRRVAGYSATGIVSERCIFMPWGGGCNGKSTWVNTLKDLFADYATQLNPEALMVKQGDAIPNDIAGLKGARFVAAIETEDGRRLAESRVKQLTGGTDSISARFMRGEWFNFKPTFKLFVATNHKPMIRGTDQAIWDRLRLIPFAVRIDDEQKDTDLPAKLAAEFPGILAWVVRGCLEWQTEGLSPPDDVSTATEVYREEMDTMGEFVEQCCIVAPGYSAGATPLYERYKIWCQLNAEDPISQKRFGMQLGEKGFVSARNSNTNKKEWHGIGLLTSNASEPSEPSRT